MHHLQPGRDKGPLRAVRCTGHCSVQPPSPHSGGRVRHHPLLQTRRLRLEGRGQGARAQRGRRSALPPHHEGSVHTRPMWVLTRVPITQGSCPARDPSTGVEPRGGPPSFLHAALLWGLRASGPPARSCSQRPQTLTFSASHPEDGGCGKRQVGDNGDGALPWSVCFWLFSLSPTPQTRVLQPCPGS